MVGGDIINFPRNPDNRLLFFMGDVCGHGVTAAFYTVLIKYLSAHSAEVYNDNPRDFLNFINEGITERINSGFVTGLAGHFGTRQKNGDRKLILSHAGHRQVLVYRKRKMPSSSSNCLTYRHGPSWDNRFTRQSNRPPDRRPLLCIHRWYRRSLQPKRRRVWHQARDGHL